MHQQDTRNEIIGHPECNSLKSYVHDTCSSNGSFDEMEMDDLFEKHQDDEADDMENGGTGEIDGEWEEDDDLPCHQHSQAEQQAPQSTYGFQSNGHQDQSQGIAAGHRQGNGNVGNNFNQTKPPKGNSQAGKRPISMASKRNSGILINFPFQICALF